MRLIWERMKIIVEPSASVTLAALLKNSDKETKRQRDKVGIIVSGGNVSVWMICRGCKKIGTERQQSMKQSP